MYRYDMLLLLLCLADVPPMEEAVKVERDCILPFIGPRGTLPAEVSFIAGAFFLSCCCPTGAREMHPNCYPEADKSVYTLVY